MSGRLLRALASPAVPLLLGGFLAGLVGCSGGVTAEEAETEIERRVVEHEADEAGLGDAEFSTTPDTDTENLTTAELEGIIWEETFGESSLPAVESVLGSGLEEFSSGICLVVSDTSVTYDDATGYYTLRTRTADLSQVMGGGGTAEEVVRGSNATGFLVDQAQVITAGHALACDITETVFLFGFVDEPGGGVRTEFPPEDVGFGDCYVATRLDLHGGDWAIVQLRPAAAAINPDRRRFGSAEMVPPAVEMDALAIGHPWGLPLRIVKGAEVRPEWFEEPWFTSTLRMYRGNSGSPIFNDDLVIGVHKVDWLHTSARWFKAWLDGTLFSVEGAGYAALTAADGTTYFVGPGEQIFIPAPPGTVIELMNREGFRQPTKAMPLPPGRSIRITEIDEQGKLATEPTGVFQVDVLEAP